MSESSVLYHQLNNGIRIVYRQIDSPVSYLGLMVGAGTRDEKPKENGIAHFIEHAVFKGTDNLTARQLINKIESVGCDLNAYTTKEETTFYASTLTAHYERALHLIADMTFHPSFPKNELNKERLVIYDEIESYNDSPSELIYDDFENLIFQEHSLHNPILGEPKTLRWLTSDKLHNFMQTAYNPDAMVFFTLSSLPFCKVLRWAEKYLSCCPYPSRAFTRQPPTQYLVAETSFHKHTHQTHCMLGNIAYPIGHDKQLGLYLLNNILGGSGMNSLLNLAVREKNGLVYTIESNYTPLSDTGYWSVYFAADESHKEQCLNIVYRQLQRLIDKPMTATTLHKYQKQLLGQMAIMAENRENDALTMAKQVLYQNVATSWQDTYKKIEQLTPDDLFHIANECYQLSDLSLLQYT